MERELLLLGLLRREEMHGYQLHDFVDSYMQTCVDLKKSTAYYLLDKMAQQGLVETSEEQVGNRPVRQVYRLTPAGEDRFQKLLRQNLGDYAPPQFGSNVGLTFLDALPEAEAAALLRRRRARLARALAEARDAPAHSGSLQLIVDHHIHHLSAELAWLDGLLARLDAGEPPPTE